MVPMRPPPLIAALIGALALAGCAEGERDAAPPSVSIYVSLPLTGPRAADGQDAADGARLALEQAGAKAGDLEVQAHFLDDARGSRWDPAAVGENARKAAQDSTAAAYIGERDSAPTRASLPITNDAGIVQVSPGAGAVDLTQPTEGYPDSPDRYRPSRDATFARLVPSDASQAAAAAELASQLGSGRYRAVSDGTRYGELMVSEFSSAAAAVGIEVVGENGRADGSFRASDAGGLRLEAGGDHVISAALDPSQFADTQFAAEFSGRYGREPGPYAAYGYEAMELVLEAIEGAEGSDEFRSDVRDAVLDAERPDSILGRYSITPAGDTTLCAVQPYELRAGRQVPGKPICPSG